MTPGPLAVRLGGVRLPSPIVVAAGCGGTGRELRPYAELSSLGAFTTRSLTLRPVRGRPGLAESPSGLITSVRRSAWGVDEFVERDLPWLAARGVRVIASIAGDDPGEYAELARRLAPAVSAGAVVAVELNLDAPPHVTQRADRHVVERADRDGVERIVGDVRRELPEAVLLAKPAAALGGLVGVVGGVVDGGADGVTLVGGLPGMAIDPGTLRPAMDGPAVVSGPAIHPVAVRAVYEVRAAFPELAIVGTGGVTSGWDALELVLAGASAVGVGSVLLRDPGAAGRITAELADALETCGLPSVEAAAGIAHHGGLRPGVQGDGTRQREAVR